MLKKILKVFLAIGVCWAAIPTSTYALSESDFTPHDTYTYIVSLKSGKALQVSGERVDAVNADATVVDGNGNNLPEIALFNVQVSTNNSNQMSFSSVGAAKRMLKSENYNGLDIINTNTDFKPEVSGWEAFTIEPQSDGTVAIKDGRLGKYLTTDENGKVFVTKTSVDGDGEKFIIINGKNPPEPDVNAEVYFKHKQTGNLVTVNGVYGDPIQVNTPVSETIPNNAKFITSYGSFLGNWIVNFASKEYNTVWKDDGNSVYQINYQRPAGWEAVTIEPQGDGTVSFKSNASNKYITVDNGKMVTPYTGQQTTDNEKFEIFTTTAPKKVTQVTVEEENETSIALSWAGVQNTLFTGYEVWRSTTIDGTYTKVGGETTATNFVDTGLEIGTTYYYVIRTVNGSSPYSQSTVVSASTRSANIPQTPTNLDVTYNNGTIKLSWDRDVKASKYEIYRAESKFGTYEKINETSASVYNDSKPNSSKYSNYYKVVAVNSFGSSRDSQIVSLETKLFGDNMLFFAQTDDTAKIDSEVARIYDIQKDAQFGNERYALMFKPGDYTKTNMMQIGFYTHVGGLGKTPTETKLNNMETPAALANNNATCNFWRSAENLSIIDTDNNGDLYFNFKWAVSQAAPLRRMYVERNSTFDWYYGWASGGFAADSVFTKNAGSYTQQQYYTRNSKVVGDFYGVNWNGFFQGVEGGNTNGDYPLIGENGNSNWNEGKGNSNYTNVDVTPVVREKPFLYLDNDEYKVFVPSLLKDSKGVSWSEGNIGQGTSLSIDEFYIAKAGVDTAATINAAIKAGKHIFLTPGIYYAEEPINVTNPNTVVLGMGMATIIPTNDQAAMIVEDVDGVTIAGIIFDAGDYSNQLLQVGRENSSNDHASNPTLLADLFFRVGGVHGGVASADIALEINSDDVIGDDFWIWRADHGDGVAWELNKSRNGLVVNGDDMTMYGLFNEHFQEYSTLWNGENGRMYFYQYETPYDPQDQSDWMSHDGTVKGYAAYKVANSVNNHYAVGLGVYDVLINTNGASVFLDNAIEVPNKSGVIVENACIVDIASSTGPLVGINSIVNGTGTGTSNGIGGKGFERHYILRYHNGLATLGDGTVYDFGIQPTAD